MKERKRYVISLWTKKRFYLIETNSLKFVKFIIKFDIWKIVKVTDRKVDLLIAYKNVEKDMPLAMFKIE